LLAVADNGEEEDRENGEDNAAVSATALDGDDIPANDDDDDVVDDGDATATTPADGGFWGVVANSKYEENK
jgi:auxin-responsive protein IAA